MALVTEGHDKYVTGTQSRVCAMMDEIERLHHNANQCRVLADSAMTAEAHDVLLDMALDYEGRVAILRANGTRSFAPVSGTSDEPLLQSA